MYRNCMEIVYGGHDGRSGNNRIYAGARQCHDGLHLSGCLLFASLRRSPRPRRAWRRAPGSRTVQTVQMACIPVHAARSPLPATNFPWCVDCLQRWYATTATMASVRNERRIAASSWLSSPAGPVLGLLRNGAPATCPLYMVRPVANHPDGKM